MAITTRLPGEGARPMSQIPTGIEATAATAWDAPRSRGRTAGAVLNIAASRGLAGSYGVPWRSDRTSRTGLRPRDRATTAATRASLTLRRHAVVRRLSRGRARSGPRWASAAQPGAGLRRDGRVQHPVGLPVDDGLTPVQYVQRTGVPGQSQRLDAAQPAPPGGRQQRVEQEASQPYALVVVSNGQRSLRAGELSDAGDLFRIVLADRDEDDIACVGGGGQPLSATTALEAPGGDVPAVTALRTERGVMSSNFVASPSCTGRTCTTRPSHNAIDRAGRRGGPEETGSLDNGRIDTTASMPAGLPAVDSCPLGRGRRAGSIPPTRLDRIEEMITASSLVGTGAVLSLGRPH